MPFVPQLRDGLREVDEDAPAKGLGDRAHPEVRALGFRFRGLGGLERREGT